MEKRRSEKGGEWGRGNKKDPFAGKEKEAKKGLEMEKEGGLLIR